jgi:hypothetical protein
MADKKKLLNLLIQSAEILGLRKDDLDIAKEYVEYNEFGLAFETVVTQVFEYDIVIGKPFYEIVTQVAELLRIDHSEYSFINELIKEDGKIPKPILDRLASIVEMVIREKQIRGS